MEAVNLFDLATRQAQWLSVRQAAVAGNIANANTPGYGTVDIAPFEAVLDGRGAAAMARTQGGHLAGRATEAGFALSQEDGADSLLPSENSVELEQELMKAGEIRREFELNAGIVKAFHRMIMLSAKV